MKKNLQISKRAQRPFLLTENVVSDHVGTFRSRLKVLEPRNASNRWLRNFGKDPYKFFKLAKTLNSSPLNLFRLKKKTKFMFF